MKTFTSRTAGTPQQAVTLAQDAHKAGQPVAFIAGGSDLLALVKDRIVEPDLLVSLRGWKDADRIVASGGQTTIGSQVTLDALSRHEAIAAQYPVLAQAAASVATPQIRYVGSLGGNVAQRPWCW